MRRAIFAALAGALLLQPLTAHARQWDRDDRRRVEDHDRDHDRDRDRERYAEHRRDWRDHDRRYGYEGREGYGYGYPAPPPPVVYQPPGLSLFFR